ncbi:hypothetical protein JXA88_16480 [Candidatus Fermentibacteria bacterium]|nr:hypothetical protein [Candidatus Fermentibacteria bacterium]
MVRLLLIAAVMCISLLPVKIAAVIVGAKRNGFLWCLLATLVAGALQLVGLGFPGPGNLVGLLLGGAGYSAILKTTYVGGLAVVVLQVFVAMAMFIGIGMLMGILYTVPRIGPIVF